MVRCWNCIGDFILCSVVRKKCLVVKFHTPDNVKVSKDHVQRIVTVKSGREKGERFKSNWKKWLQASIAMYGREVEKKGA